MYNEKYESPEIMIICMEPDEGIMVEGEVPSTSMGFGPMT